MHHFQAGALAAPLLAVFMMPSVAFGAAPGPQAFQQLLAAEWESELVDSPELATLIGDYRFNDRWSDPSLRHVKARRAELARFASQFAAVDPHSLSDEDQLNRELIRRQLDDEIRSIDFKQYEMPLDQFNGVHLEFVQFVATAPFDAARHYEDYLARLRALPAILDTYISVLEQGRRDGLMPPRYLLDKVVTQCQSIAAPAGGSSAFAEPLLRFPDTVSAADRQRLKAGILTAIDEGVRPAYVRLASFVAKSYAPEGREQPGVWALADGAARYRSAISHHTTTSMSPEAIHQLGLSEVNRIEAEMTDIVKRLGYADLATARAAFKGDPATHAHSRDQILELYRSYIAGMNAMLPRQFGVLPKSSVGVRAVEEFREKDASGAFYVQGTPDGSRPGAIYVNTGDFTHRSLLTIESTAYHEGVPGHHLQVAIAQALPDLPPFRQQASYTAYVEGWALYSERLGKEVGFYKDPRSDYGRLADELLRADRLVLDTGVHFKRWTREQMVNFFHSHSSEDEPDLQAETDRYIAYPGQALAYKVGELKIRELREYAKRTLGNQFDIRAFHDAVLTGGALPLDVLETRIRSWVAAKAPPSR